MISKFSVNNVHACRSLLLGTILGMTNLSYAASSENIDSISSNLAKATILSAKAAVDCSSVTNPQYIEANNLLCLPIVEVPGNAKTEFYNAQLKLDVSTQGAFTFTLLRADLVSSSSNNHPTYIPETGIVNIPLVELIKTYGTERYSAALTLTPNSNPFSFATTSINAVISADYKQGVTWKPYVGLLPNEKEAVNYLQESQPYSVLAEAIYDFNNKEVGDWQLIQSTNQNSGMQAGVFRNRLTGELVIAFRGTELCLNPISCSGNQILDSNKDLATDAALTQGRDFGQFDDAFIYTSEIVKANPNTKITVTGHSLGGGLAQAAGASFLLPTFAFNSSPVPNNFYDAHGVKQTNSQYAQLIHVLSDIHDPVSSTNNLGLIYSDAAHVTTNLQFDFDKKEVLPTYKTNLDSLRLNKHSITVFKENIKSLTVIYQQGW